MDVESDPVAGPVKVALHAPIDKPCLISRLFKPAADALMNSFSICPIFDFCDGLFLCIQDGLIQPLQFRTRGPTDDGPGHVGKIPVGSGPGKHVEDNAAMSR
jgi:hypothetical protein